MRGRGGGRKHGDHIGGIRTLEDLRGRCVIRPDDECWHIRTARGKPHPKGRVQHIWVYGIGKTTVTRAVVYLVRGKMPRRNLVCYRTCTSYDCANPGHIAVTSQESWAAALNTEGKIDPTKRKAASIARSIRTNTLPVELRRWLQESQQPATEIAAILGLPPRMVRTTRLRDRKLMLGGLLHAS